MSQMGSGKKKEGPVVKPSDGTTILISTLKQQLPKEQEKPEATKGQIPMSGNNKEVKTDSQKLSEAVRPPVRLSDYTGKDRQRYWEWVRFKTPIKIKLGSGEQWNRKPV